MTLRDTLSDDEIWLFQARTEHYRSAMAWLHILTVRVFAISLLNHQDWAMPKPVRRRMIWNIRGDFGAEVIGSLGSGYAALR